MVQRCPLAFCSSLCADTSLQCALAASLHMHREAFSSVMKYFKDLITSPMDKSLVRKTYFFSQKTFPRMFLINQL